MLSVIKTGGKQYIVSAGKKFKVEKLVGNAGDNVEFDAVLLKADEDKVEIGAPYLKDEKVSAKLVKQGRAKKVRVVKYKRKVRYHKVHGHRQAFTEVEIV